MKRRVVLHTGSLLTGFFFLFSSVNVRAESGAGVLAINTSARAAGVGMAYTALADSVDAMNWNAAGIARRPSTQTLPSSAGLTFSHQDHFSDSKLDYFALAIPQRMNSRAPAVGVSVTRLGYADQDRRLATGEKVGTVSSNDFVSGLSLAHNFGGLQAGTQVKFLQLSLDGYTAKGYAVDLGLISRLPVRGLSLGVAARNIGPQMKFIQDRFDLPLTLSIGTAYQVSAPFTIALDLANRPRDGQTSLSIGSEIIAIRTVSLRAGYIAKLATAVQNNQESESLRGNYGGIGGFNAGLGIRFAQFSMDYSMSPFGELGTTQILSMSTWFGGDSRKKDLSVFEKDKVRQPLPNVPERVIILLDNGSATENWWHNLRP